MLVDTGAPLVFVDPRFATDAQANEGRGVARSFEAFGGRFRNLPFVPAQVVTPALGAPALGGIIGCAAFCDYGLSLDYQGERIALGADAEARDPRQTIEVPMMVLGGGLGTAPGTPATVHIPASRGLVHAHVEGRAVLLLVDTGASATVLRASILAELDMEARAFLLSPVASMFGTSEARLMRARSLRVGEAERTGIVIAEDPVFEGLLDLLEEEVGMPIDGVLGASYLQHFSVAVDHPRQTLRLRPYTDDHHVYDLGIRVGIRLGAGNIIAEVRPDTSADAAGLMPGVTLRAIDGIDVSGHPSPLSEALLGGPRGAAHALTVEATTDGGPARTVIVEVDDDWIPL